MSDGPSPPECIIVAANPQLETAAELAATIAEELAGWGVESSSIPLMEESIDDAFGRYEADLLVALGGDGTMLRAGQLAAPRQVPILGINVGRLGFLTEVKRDSWRQALESVLAGDYWVERRMMLRTEKWWEQECKGTWHVLNEAVIGRGETVRPVELITEADGRFLTTYMADALIVATATGSTAYALAAGGPILPPELRNILLVPVAPHLSLDRAIVLHEGTSVQVTVRTDHHAILSTDGRVSVPLEDGAQVRVCAGEHTAEFVRLQDPGYFYRNLTSHMNNQTTAREAP